MKGKTVQSGRNANVTTAAAKIVTGYTPAQRQPSQMLLFCCPVPIPTMSGVRLACLPLL